MLCICNVKVPLRNDGGDDEGEADEAGVVGALLTPRRVLRLLGELGLPHIQVQSVQGRVRLRETIPSVLAFITHCTIESNLQ